MVAFLVSVGLVAVIVFYAISLFNRLVKLKNMVGEGASGIDVQLKRRSDLIPNLVETVKGYAAHEKQTLENVIAARNKAVSAGGFGEKGKAEGELSQALGRLFALSEAYPDLKADQNFRQLQGELTDTENQIQSARRYYNAAARDLNVAVESFPSNLIAKNFGFSTAEFFELDNPADRETPQVKF